MTQEEQSVLARIDARLSRIEKLFIRMQTSMNSIVNEYQNHGTSIAYLRMSVDRISTQCPLIRPPTDEYQELCPSGNNDGTKNEQ